MEIGLFIAGFATGVVFVVSLVLAFIFTRL